MVYWTIFVYFNKQNISLRHLAKTEPPRLTLLTRAGIKARHSCKKLNNPTRFMTCLTSYWSYSKGPDQPAWFKQAVQSLCCLIKSSDLSLLVVGIEDSFYTNLSELFVCWKQYRDIRCNEIHTLYLFLVKIYLKVIALRSTLRLLVSSDDNLSKQFGLRSGPTKKTDWNLELNCRRQSVQKHWCSSHYAVTHVHNKNSNIQGRSSNVVKVIFHATRNCS